MQTLFRLASRNLLRSRLRSLITLAAITCGVCALILAGGFVRDIYIQLGEALIHSQSGHLQLARSEIFGSGSRSPERYLLDDASQWREQLEQLPEVRQVMARISFSALLNNGKTDYAIIADGIEADRENALGSHLRVIAGRSLQDSDHFGAMLGEGVAQALQLQPGDQATLLVSTIDGAMNTLDVDIVGVFRSFSKDFDARAVRIGLADAQTVLDTEGVGKLVIELDETASTTSVVEHLRHQLTSQPAGKGLAVQDWQQLNDFYEKTVDLYRQQFGFLKTMVLLMVCLSVINTVNMSLLERTWEFGTMRALGNRSASVSGLIYCESLLLGLCGASLGLLLGAGLATLISGVGIPMPPPPNAEEGYDAFIRIVPAVAIEAWLIGVLATVIAAIYPAWRVSRMTIIDALHTRA
ncbi:MAG: FtsX-like permease family protein [Thauera sp.]|jgi:putative ABC transport system permease protein|nr:FtsX-like permease family protein [Thauera sp.]